MSDLGAVREQAALFGGVASDSTAFRMVDRIAQTPGMLDALRSAHTTARKRFWELSGAPARLTVDVDATLITAHSEKERAAGTCKQGYGFHPLAVYTDETREALAIMLQPGNAGSNTAADHVTVIDRALAQIPDAQVEMIDILIRADSAGATHQTADHCHSCDLRFSFGYELTEPVRAAILKTPDDAWVSALDQDGSARENGQVTELTAEVGVSSWPQGSRVIVRRERPHPGAQFSFINHDGYRFQAILTDQPIPPIRSWSVVTANATACPAGVLRTPSQAAPSHRLAVDPSAHSRVWETRRASRPGWLKTPLTTGSADQTPRPRPRSPLPRARSQNTPDAVAKAS